MSMSFKLHTVWRSLCSEVDKGAVVQLLKRMNRPKMGQAKAKTSAGKKALDLDKGASKLPGDWTVERLLKTNTKELREHGFGCQERKRMLKFLEKVRQGWIHKEAAGGLEKHLWRGWRPVIAPKRLHPNNDRPPPKWVSVQPER